MGWAQQAQGLRPGPAHHYVWYIAWIQVRINHGGWCSRICRWMRNDSWGWWDGRITTPGWRRWGRGGSGWLVTRVTRCHRSLTSTRAMMVLSSASTNLMAMFATLFIDTVCVDLVWSTVWSCTRRLMWDLEMEQLVMRQVLMSVLTLALANDSTCIGSHRVAYSWS